MKQGYLWYGVLHGERMDQIWSEEEKRNMKQNMKR